MRKAQDPAVAAILAALLELHDDESNLPVVSLSKQLGFPLSLVMRTVSTLVDAKLVELKRLHDQNIGAGLTQAGLGLARQQQRPVD